MAMRSCLSRNILIILLCLQNGLIAADRSTVEGIRQTLILKANSVKVDEALRQKYIALIGNDDSPLAMADVLNILRLPKTSGQDATTWSARRQLYIIASLFRFREQPKEIEKVFDAIRPEERELCAGLWRVVFEPFISPGYGDMLHRGLRESVGQSCVEGLSREAKGRFEEAARMWLELLVKCDPKLAGESLLPLLQSEVSDSDMRFNLTALFIARAGKDAMPVARWYFERYAFRPFELKVLSEYLVRYGSSDEGAILVGTKIKSLTAGIDALKAASEQPHTTTRATTAPAAPSANVTNEPARP